MTKEQEIRKEIKQIVDEMPVKEIKDRIKQDEQEEAIENFRREFEQCNYNKSDLIIELDYAKIIIDMIDNNSAEIEQKNTELAEKNTEIERLNRQIDLITEFLGERDLGYYKNETGGEILGIMRKYNKEDWKEYFERKATNNG